MEPLEWAVLGLVFYVVYEMSATKKELKTKEKNSRSTKFEQYVHRYREQGVDRDTVRYQAMEVARRGIDPALIPYFGNEGMSPEEVAARVKIMHDEVPYKPFNLLEPTQDSSLAKSTTEIWTRPIEDDDS